MARSDQDTVMWLAVFVALLSATAALPWGEETFSAAFDEQVNALANEARRSGYELGECVQCEDSVARKRTVQTLSGPVEGVIRQGVQQFLGIPYARPPVDDLRFMPPVPPEPWSEALRARSFGRSCVQYSVGVLSLYEGEDCLFLNVWAPEHASAGSSLPVMVWIHGGGFVQGSSSIYLPAELMKSTHDQVIVVTINYRLSMFGFLAAPEMDDGMLNAGVADQRLAMKWVQGNIAQFGGDPNRVTLFGESAGGGSISLHLCSKESTGLYHRAISESPGMWKFNVPSEAAELSRELARSVECPEGTGMLQCLQRVPLSTLKRNKVKMMPVVAHSVIPDQPVRLISQGLANDVPLVIGVNEREGDFFVLPVKEPPIPDSQYDFWMMIAFPDRQLRKFVKTLYEPLRSEIGNWHTISQAVGDSLITCGAQLASNGSMHMHSKVYSYVFTQTSPYAAWNATHTSELPFVFARYQQFTPEDEVVVERMTNWWVNFAVSGDPNNGSASTPPLPHWPPFDPSSNSPTVMKMGSSGELLLPPFNHRFCPAWSAEYFTRIPPL